MDSIDTLVVGAGVIGLAVARALAMAGHEVLVVEKEAAIGTETSARNSEVIHAGLYYPPTSQMARLCIAGRHALYAYCAQRHIPHRACGKLVVATTPEQIPALHDLYARAQANGVEDLHLLGADQACALEPALHCVAALHSSHTGIIDSHAYMLALQADAEQHGATFAFHAPVQAVEARPDGFVARIGTQPDDFYSLHARNLINAAGLYAPSLAHRIVGLDTAHVPHAYYAKGSYFALSGQAPFSRLIYPLPEPGGLGTHLTLDMAGQARFGPDLEWVEQIDYNVAPARAASFARSIRHYWPSLPENALHPAYAGIRPKIVPPSVGRQDFLIQGADVHGLPGLVNLFGIESPGLTASLAIAEAVACQIKESSILF